MVWLSEGWMHAYFAAFKTTRGYCLFEIVINAMSHFNNNIFTYLFSIHEQLLTNLLGASLQAAFGRLLGDWLQSFLKAVVKPGLLRLKNNKVYRYTVIRRVKILVWSGHVGVPACPPIVAH